MWNSLKNGNMKQMNENVCNEKIRSRMPEGLYGTMTIDKNKKQKHYVFRLNMNGYNFFPPDSKEKQMDRSK
jgi:hypothetical protein